MLCYELCIDSISCDAKLGRGLVYAIRGVPTRETISIDRTHARSFGSLHDFTTHLLHFILG